MFLNVILTYLPKLIWSKHTFQLKTRFFKTRYESYFQNGKAVNFEHQPDVMKPIKLISQFSAMVVILIFLRDALMNQSLH